MRIQTLASFAAMVSAALLTGCSTNFKPSPLQTEQSSIGEIHGSLHGGQAPISGAQIYLYAAGTGGYGTSATSLIRAGSNTLEDGNGNFYVLTDVYGNFSVGGDYTCTAGTQVYAVAVGGDSGGGDNSAIVQMAGLGQCPAAGNLGAQVPYLVINEVSTVVFAYAMSGFGTTPYNISSDAGSSTLAATAIANAMANVTNIMDIGTGQPYTSAAGNANSTVPQAKIYALANVLAACVNSPQPTSSSCSTLFNNATSDGTASGTPATDEATAIFNIAHHPAANVSTLFGLQQTTPPFPTNLASAPADWTLPIVYSGIVSLPVTDGNKIVSGPFNIAFDADGNAWIGDRVKGVIRMGPQGAVTTYNSSFGMIKGVAVSPAGTIWAADYGARSGLGSVYLLDASGSVDQTITVDINGPAAVAFDATGDGYVLNEVGSSVALFDSTGSNLIDEEGFDSTAIATPGWIAVDTEGDALVPSTSTGNVGEFQIWVNNKGKTKYGTTTLTGTSSYATAIDSSGNLWFASDTGTAQLDEAVPNTRVRNNKTSFTLASVNTGGGMSTPYKLSIDGNDTIWIANEGSVTVSAFNIASRAWLSSAGFATGGSSTGVCIAATPDSAGNLWTANGDGTVSQILGLATPTATPFFPGNLGMRP